MAVWTADKAVLSLADDPSQRVTFYTTARARTHEVPGGVIRMANGRLRTVRRKGSATQTQVTAVSLTPAEAATLESWAGRTVLFRDGWGFKEYGAFFTVAHQDFTDRDRRNLSITLSTVSVVEVVP